MAFALRQTVANFHFNKKRQVLGSTNIGFLFSWGFGLWTWLVTGSKVQIKFEKYIVGHTHQRCSPQKPQDASHPVTPSANQYWNIFYTQLLTELEILRRRSREDFLVRKCFSIRSSCLRLQNYLKSDVSQDWVTARTKTLQVCRHQKSKLEL